MRELAVFYCPKCGYYAYYQTSRHPQCPRCCHPDVMHMVRMYYKEFMDMGCRERDDYLAQEIMKDNPSFLKRINAPHKRFNSREIIAEMNIEIMRLDTENKILSDTVKWMHDTIWEMIICDHIIYLSAFTLAQGIQIIDRPGCDLLSQAVDLIHPFFLDQLNTEHKLICSRILAEIFYIF